MNAAQRRQAIMRCLNREPDAITASALAAMFSVSRQVIVQDIAILRAGGADILATPAGYIVPRASFLKRPRRVICCKHEREEQMVEELMTIVRLGGCAVDVTVEHPVYGEFKAMLMVGTERDVRRFIARLRENGAGPLSAITGGLHLHMVEADSEEALDKIVAALAKAGILQMQGEEQ